MRYQSNLEAPDISRYFTLADPPRTNMTHDEPHDPDFDNPPCGSWTHDEAAILYNVARQVKGNWLDCGARLGWTGAHIVSAQCTVGLIDMEYRNADFLSRLRDNVRHCRGYCSIHEGKTEDVLRKFRNQGLPARGAVIDADHDPPQPWADAMGCLRHLDYDCVIMFHDCLMGPAVRDAMRHLIDGGFRCRFYWTPNGVGCCWRGLPNFVPPDHVSDPALAAEFLKHKANMVDFNGYWAKCE